MGRLTQLAKHHLREHNKKMTETERERGTMRWGQRNIVAVVRLDDLSGEGAADEW